MNILIVGTGYVGLVTGTCFAEMGHHVICLDIDKEKVAKLNQGVSTIYEPGLSELIIRNLHAKRLSFTTDYNHAVNACDVSFIAVNTPMGPDGEANLSSVKQAAEQIAHEMKRYHLIVNKSTVPVGAADLVKSIIEQTLKKRGMQIPFDVASNPEFLKEGDAVNDFMKPDRIVIGAENPRAIAILKEIYSAFTLNSERFLIMSAAAAEMTKYAANAMLATRISFMNELAGLCEKLGVDISQVRKGIGSDSRIGLNFLYPGIGFGGSCFPKDLKALRAMALKAHHPTHILDAVEKVNAEQKTILAKKIEHYFVSKGGVKNATIAIWGLSFKPNTDDMREAPALKIIEQLSAAGAHFRIFDPIAIDNGRKHPALQNKKITWCDSELEAAEGADAIVLATEWRQFRYAAMDRVLGAMKGKAFFDGRNQYNPQDMAEKGFDYFSIGRQPAFAKAADAARSRR